MAEEFWVVLNLIPVFPKASHVIVHSRRPPLNFSMSHSFGVAGDTGTELVVRLILETIFSFPCLLQLVRILFVGDFTASSAAINQLHRLRGTPETSMLPPGNLTVRSAVNTYLRRETNIANKNSVSVSPVAPGLTSLLDSSGKQSSRLSASRNFSTYSSSRTSLPAVLPSTNSTG